ncbi:hypothetical protein HZB88_02150 [archaeon]|nr:hypothetical protein [archaeon]
MNTTFANHTSITSGNTTKGESWIASIRIYDGYEWGNWLNSSASTINNAPPSIPTLGNPADGARTTGNSVTLNCASSSDIDGDTINYEFYGSTTNPPTTLLQNSTGTTYAWATTDGNTYYWRCKANDASSASGYTSVKSFTENALPIVTSANITNSDANNYTNGTLSLSYAFSDSNSDAESAKEIKWFINNILNTTFANHTSITSGNTTKGESWIASIRIYDGYEWGCPELQILIMMLCLII